MNQPKQVLSDNEVQDDYD